MTGRFHKKPGLPYKGTMEDKRPGKERARGMSSYDFDLLVIGGGSGGVATARRAAERGAKVAVCEDHQWGGTCVHRGCVPKKLLVYSSGFGYQRKLMKSYGWEPQSAQVDWPSLIANIQNETARLEGFYKQALEGEESTRIKGTARLRDPHTVEVAGNTYTAERILLAVGGKPWVPEGIEGRELGITSDDVFHLPALPASLLVVGSGYIGTEFAGVFRGLGVEVHQSFRSQHVLPGFDGDLRTTVQEEMEKRGVVFHPGDQPRKIETAGEGRRRVTMASGQVLEVDQVLLATGRRPRTEGLGLEEVGVQLGDKGEVKVDEGYQTSVPSVYALGDCIMRIELTPVAIAEGRRLAEHLFNEQPLTMSYQDVPTAVFSSPPAATVGKTEEQLREAGVAFDIYRAKFRPMKYTLPDLQNKGLLKLLVCRETDRVLGCHLVGEEAPELIQPLGVCLKAGATKAIFDDTIAVHPTFSEELVLMRKPSVRVEGNNR